LPLDDWDGGEKMTLKTALRSSVLGAAIFLLAAGSAKAFLPFILPPQEGPVGKAHEPVIEAVSAQKEIGIGQLWKIYIRASDPDGDVDKIYVSFSQLGVSYIALPLLLDRPVKKIQGAVLTWTTLASTSTQTGVIYASAEVRVEDRAGNVSDSKTFEFILDPYGPKDKFAPPAALAEGPVYGQVDFPIRSEDELGTDGEDDRPEN
jgi:hypothetical protein|tara:strand:+ start:86 stop:700 length:615 start_codon:yes stop_codon:yes gene_type:complete